MKLVVSGALIRRTLGAVALLLPAARAFGLPVAGGDLLVSRTPAAEGCPDQAALAATTLALGTRPVEENAAELRVHVEFDRSEEGFVARIRATGRKTGYREIRAPGETCGPLAEATSVAVAILFDLLPPEPETPEPPPLPATSPPPTPLSLAIRPEPSFEPLTHPQKAKGTPVPPEPFAFAGGYGGLAYGLLGAAPTAHVGGSLGARLTSSLEVRAGGFYTPGRTLPHGRGTVSVSLAAGKAELVVWLLRRGDFQLGPKLELGVGALRGSGRDFDHEDSSSDLWLAAGAGGTSRLMLGRSVGLVAGISLFVPHRTQRFSVAGVPGVGFESSPAALLLEVGPELAFW